MWIFSWKWKMKTLSMYSSSRREERAKDGAHVDDDFLFFFVLFTSTAVQGWNGKGFGNLMFKLIDFFFLSLFLIIQRPHFHFCNVLPEPNWKWVTNVIPPHTHTFRVYCMPIIYVFVLCTYVAPPPSIFIYKEGSFVKGCLWLLCMVSDFL